MANPLLLLAALGIGAAALAFRRGATSSSAAVGAPAKLQAGVPYLFIVRLDVPDAQAETTLESKGVEMLEFAEVTSAPPWAVPGQPASPRVASFKATPAGNSTVTFGMPFYGIGKLERISRLDGQPFDAPP